MWIKKEVWMNYLKRLEQEIENNFSLVLLDNQIRDIKKSGREAKEIIMSIETFFDFEKRLNSYQRFKGTPLTYRGIPVKEKKNIMNWYIEVRK